MFKYKDLENLMYQLIKEILNTETMPVDWKRVFIVPILKKGHPNNCNNYTGISLLNISYKLMSTLINNKIMDEYQFGFEKGRLTIYSILKYINRKILKAVFNFEEKMPVGQDSDPHPLNTIHTLPVEPRRRTFKSPTEKLEFYLDMCVLFSAVLQ